MQTYRLGELLIQKKLVSSQEIKESLVLQQESNQKIGEILIKKNLIGSEDLARTLQEQYWRNQGFWVIH